MKLEFKYLAPYLPYELKLSCDNIYKGFICKLVVNNNTNSLTNGFNIDQAIEYKSKPILRPLSDYDKVENDFELSTDFDNSYFTGSLTEIAFINTKYRTYLSDMLTVTEFLFENHFDVFGLIEKGLAIDINTIK